MDWLTTLRDTLAAGTPVVRVVVARVRGSTPREEGTVMLVTAGGQHGTIGGGHLELVATRIARDMLRDAAAAPRVDRFSLGASLGQCCGGIVELAFIRQGAADLAWVDDAIARRDTEADPVHVTVIGDLTLREPLRRDATDLWIFGAGHVGRALVGMLGDLPFRITWVDSRDEAFPVVTGEARTIETDSPADAVAAMPAGAWALVMTHSHDEDFAICKALLRTDRAAWIGLIGSGPKATRFRQRLAQRGFGGHDIARIVSPIGLGTIRSKAPAAIAVSVAAQLLQLREVIPAQGVAPADIAGGDDQ